MRGMISWGMDPLLNLASLNLVVKAVLTLIIIMLTKRHARRLVEMVKDQPVEAQK